MRFHIISSMHTPCLLLLLLTTVQLYQKHAYTSTPQRYGTRSCNKYLHAFSIKPKTYIMVNKPVISSTIRLKPPKILRKKCFCLKSLKKETARDMFFHQDIVWCQERITYASRTAYTYTLQLKFYLTNFINCIYILLYSYTFNIHYTTIQFLLFA
jgi:hypothetical protein